jgi:hypothetical protein
VTPYITERNSIGIWQNKQLCHDTPPPSFVTIEGQLLSVRTVINMLHFLNQLIVYTIKSHLSLLPPFINTMYVTTWPISKRGNKWEMLSYEAWTDGRTTVCHNKPVCWRAYKNEWPISWNYEYIIFGQIIFQNIHQFKTFVGLSDCRILATAPLQSLQLLKFKWKWFQFNISYIVIGEILKRVIILAPCIRSFIEKKLLLIIGWGHQRYLSWQIGHTFLLCLFTNISGRRHSSPVKSYSFVIIQCMGGGYFWPAAEVII